MKILIATDGMDIGGAETHVFTLINELKRRGIDVTLISAGGPYADILEKSGVRCIKAPLNKRDPISIIRSKIALSKAMRQTDIVHAHTRFTAFIAKSIRGAAKYPKIVTTAHLNFPLFPFGAFAFWGDGTLAVSEDIREYLMTNYGLTPKDVCLTKNALDVSAYQNARLDTKVIIHTSRIDTGRSKAAFLLVEAARDILSRHPDWRILIVGDGNRLPVLLKKQKRRTTISGLRAFVSVAQEVTFLRFYPMEAYLLESAELHLRVWQRVFQLYSAEMKDTAESSIMITLVYFHMQISVQEDWSLQRKMR